MQTRNRVLDDLARVASGAVTSLSSVREEMETRFKERLERFAADMDLVTREEYDAVKAMAAKARDEQVVLAERVAALEARLDALKKTAPRARKKATPKIVKDEGDSSTSA